MSTENKISTTLDYFTMRPSVGTNFHLSRSNDVMRSPRQKMYHSVAVIPPPASWGFAAVLLSGGSSLTKDLRLSTDPGHRADKFNVLMEST